MSSADQRPTVLVAAGSFTDPERVVAGFGEQCEIRFGDVSTPESVAVASAGAEAIVVATQRLSAEQLAALQSTVRVIGRAGVGLDSIDLDAAARLGITVVNQPAYGASEVASHAVSLICALQRKLWEGDRFVRAGWSGDLHLVPIEPLDEATVGLVGCGRIGLETARKIQALVKEVLVFDPFAAELPAYVTRVVGLDEMLQRAQILSVHSPLTPETRGLIGHRELSLLPEGAIVVNVARGGIVDESALVDLLVSGHLGGAGLDVFEQEPLPAESPILAAPNTIVTPHCAAYSERAMWRLVSWTMEDTLEWLRARRIVRGNLVVDGTR